jgi:hypothetical protein
MSNRAQEVADEYLNISQLKYDPDFHQIFIVDKKGRRYPLVYTQIKRIIASLNDLSLTAEELKESERLIAQFIIEAVEQKIQKQKNAAVNEDEKSNK